MRNKNIIISVLLILLVLTIGYIVYSKYLEKMEDKKLEFFQAGYSKAILDVAQQVSTCQQIPLKVGNQTINILDVRCLR